MERIYKAVEKEMIEVNNNILLHLKSDEELVSAVCQHLLNSAGKRLRPMLTIICSKIFEYEGTSHIDLASSIEFIHAATLLHDDVVDNSEIRRFKPTANKIWGDKISILVGDFLFAQSFKLMVNSGSMDALRSLANASAIISEGEVMQLSILNRKSMITEPEYINIVRAKTAELFGASCEVGAIISGNRSASALLKEFGIKLGIIFQIIDDLLDYTSDKDLIGKNIGDDFSEGKITLPIILAYEQSSNEERVLIEDAIFNKQDNSSFCEIKSIFVRKSIEEQIYLRTQNLMHNAVKILEQLHGNDIYKGYLIQILHYAASRRS